MRDRIYKIAQDICTEVKKVDGLPVQHIRDHLQTLVEGEELSNKACLDYLLYIACCYNLKNSLSELLEMGLDVNTILQSYRPDTLLRLCGQNAEESKIEPLFTPIPEKTLLSLACKTGNIDMVKHLVENHSADVNKQDNLGNTALHYTVFLDSARIGNENIGKIAAYLLEHSADMFIKNNKKQTPYGAANKNAPSFCQRLFGYRDPKNYLYDGDVTRPIFEQILHSKKLSNPFNK